MRDRPIYHITHIGNLPSVLASGRLWCDAQCRRRGCTANDVGYSHIKDRRMRRQVSVHPETTLGQFVPFNFCSRSVMLYVLHKGHDGYRGGQNPVARHGSPELMLRYECNHRLPPGRPAEQPRKHRGHCGPSAFEPRLPSLESSHPLRQTCVSFQLPFNAPNCYENLIPSIHVFSW